MEHFSPKQHAHTKRFMEQADHIRLVMMSADMNGLRFHTDLSNPMNAVHESGIFQVLYAVRPQAASAWPAPRSCLKVDKIS